MKRKTWALLKLVQYQGSAVKLELLSKSFNFVASYLKFIFHYRETEGVFIYRISPDLYRFEQILVHHTYYNVLW